MDSRWQTATLEDGAQQTLRDDGEFGPTTCRREPR